jgi:hypothetical protein
MCVCKSRTCIRTCVEYHVYHLSSHPDTTYYTSSTSPSPSVRKSVRTTVLSTRLFAPQITPSRPSISQKHVLPKLDEFIPSPPSSASTPPPILAPPERAHTPAYPHSTNDAKLRRLCKERKLFSLTALTALRQNGFSGENGDWKGDRAR